MSGIETDQQRNTAVITQ